MADKRLGTMAAGDTPAVWPETTVTGQTYTRPCSTLNIGGGLFIVRDMFHSEAENKAIAELLTAHGNPTTADDVRNGTIKLVVAKKGKGE